MEGERSFRRFTRYRTRSGKRFTGSGIWTSACWPSSSSLLIHEEMVAAVSPNVSAVWTSVQPRAALSSRIAILSRGG
jgi:hypothetical protein